MKTFDKVHFKGIFRKYQQRILNNADKYLLNGKINIVAAPGSGKTILGLELIKRLNAPTIILSPSTTIKYQWGDRFKDGFLDEGEKIDDYFSYDLHEITLINSITYQALHSIMNKLPLEEDGEVTDYSDLDIFELVRKYNVKTICLDEAHHLQNEWQKSLEKFMEQLGEDVKVVALTATPPYDANKAEWDRYEKVCGPIDEEIFVPELVKEGTLCPHQDYVYFNYPTKEETEVFTAYKAKVLNAIKEFKKLDIVENIYATIVDAYHNDKEYFYDNAEHFLLLLAIAESIGTTIEPKILKHLAGKKGLPVLTIASYERAIAFCLEDEKITTEREKERIIKLLKTNSVYERNKVNFTLKESMKHKLISSIGKLNSIARITKSESNNMGDKLRLLILTDYIKKESIKDLFNDNISLQISVVSIFEVLVKTNPNYRMGILSGNLIVLPIDCKDQFPGRRVKCDRIGDTNYAEFTFAASLHNKDKVDLVAKLFEKGVINIIIGTKALLGEGWDSPCINTLILASFVGSFMLSNQMRGRAIRMDRKNPNKVANIWHLATIEPEYIFEYKHYESLKIKKETEFSQIASYDYEVLQRRFDCFVGPNYETGEIESGIERLTTILPPYNESGFDRINHLMLAQAARRDDTNNNWDTSLRKNFKVTEEISIPREVVIPPFAYVNVIGLVIYGLVDSLAHAVFCYSLSAFLTAVNGPKTGNFVLSLLFLIASIIVIGFFTFGLVKLIEKAIIHSSPKKNMTFIANALLKTLQYSGFISDRARLDVVGDEVYIRLQLKEASRYEQNLFNEAINEMFSPIDNPRYLLILCKKGRYNYERTYSCPSVLGKKKVMVDLFAENLVDKVGTFKVVYTRSDEGRALILKCRKRSILNQNDRYMKKMLKKTTKIS